MLVLSRKPLEKIIVVIGGIELWITAVGVRGGQDMRLGFDGPPEFQVYREEVWKRVNESKEPPAA